MPHKFVALFEIEQCYLRRKIYTRKIRMRLSSRFDQ